MARGAIGAIQVVQIYGAKAMSKISVFITICLASLPLLAQTSGEGADKGAPPMPQTQQTQQMQARMQAMHAQMALIQATKDPAERQRLMQEHMQTMHESMTMMGGMMSGPMGQGGGAAQRMQQCAQDDTNCRMERMQNQQQMMGQRMNMMQQMMEQMMGQMMESQSSSAKESKGQ
jgi:hypothetical protein